jgi:hypothetical protein
MNNAQNAVARSLRLGADDGKFLADEGVQQSGLSRIRATDDADETGVD